MLFILTLLFTYSVSHPLCSDGSTAVPTPTLSYCIQYQDNSCCPDDSEIEIEVNNLGVLSTDPCYDFLKQTLCVTCDPWAAHLLGEGIFARPVPALCNDYCTQLYSTCRFETFPNDNPFNTTRLIDKWLSAEDFCSEYPPIDAYCFDGSNYTPPPVTGGQGWTSNGICVDRVVSETEAGPTGFLTLASPVDDKIFVGTREGNILVYLTTTVPFQKLGKFLDLTSKVSMLGEGGLLGLAFHPNYTENGKFYVSYTCDPTICKQPCILDEDCQYDGQCVAGFCNDNQLMSVIEEYKVSLDPNNAGAESNRTVLQLSQPGLNHKGGDLHFGPDGYLYIFFGEGGGFSSKGPQCNDMWLGKILRIDVNGNPYAIPTDNPFVGLSQYKPEIWALGFRNPWRNSFDFQTGQLFVGDVGQDRYEEVNIVKKGKDYGWAGWEGFATFDRDNVPIDQVTFPDIVYKHNGIAAVIGGYVYRGPKDTCHQGIYIFNDQTLFNNNTFSFGVQDGNGWTMEAVSWVCGSEDHPLSCMTVPSIPMVNSWGQDKVGNLYFLESNNIYQIIELDRCPSLHCHYDDSIEVTTNEVTTNEVTTNEVTTEQTTTEQTTTEQTTDEQIQVSSANRLCLW